MRALRFDAVKGIRLEDAALNRGFGLLLDPSGTQLKILIDLSK